MIGCSAEQITSTTSVLDSRTSRCFLLPPKESTPSQLTGGVQLGRGESVSIVLTDDKFPSRCSDEFWPKEMMN